LPYGDIGGNLSVLSVRATPRFNRSYDDVSDRHHREDKSKDMHIFFIRKHIKTSDNT